MSLSFAVVLLDRLPARWRDVVRILAVGLAAGLAAVLFHLAIGSVFSWGIEAAAARGGWRFLVWSFVSIGVGAGVSGWLLTRFCPEAAGSGIPQVKLAFWKDFGVIPFRVVWVKFVAGALSVGGGCSLGREGPSVQLAGGVGSWLAGLLGVPSHLRRAACVAGAASGLAAAFNTPIAAVTFALEEIIGDLNSRLLGSVLLASVAGALVAHGILGEQPAFGLRGVGTPSLTGLLLAIPVAAAAAAVGCGFQSACLGLRERARRITGVPGWVRVLVGCLLAWAIGAAVFLGSGHLGVFSLGYADLSSALDGELGWRLAGLLLVAKLAATVLCYGVGGCGGIFAPTLFFGAMTGLLVGALASRLHPLGAADCQVLTVVGMCACLGAVVRAPVTGLLIVFEMTHEFALVPALIVGGLVSAAVGRSLSHANFYEAVLEQDGHRMEKIVPPHTLRGWLDQPVARIANFAPELVGSLEPNVLRAQLRASRHARLPVVVDGRLVGVVDRLRTLAALESGGAPVVEEAAVCLAGMSLREVQSRLLSVGGHFAVVMDREAADGAVLGVLTLHDLLRAELARSEEL